jgi:hypothetical protein
MIDRKGMKRTIATLEAMVAEDNLYTVTPSEHYWFIGIMQSLVALLVLFYSVVASPLPAQWWAYVLPNVLVLVLTIVAPWPLRVGRAAAPADASLTRGDDPRIMAALASAIVSIVLARLEAHAYVAITDADRQSAVNAVARVLLEVSAGLVDPTYEEGD